MSDDPRRTQPFCTPRCYRVCQCSRWPDMLDRWGNPVNHGEGGDVPAATPWSLYYDGSNDETDCGNDASIMGLNAAAFTVDIYMMQAGTGIWERGTPISQGDYYFLPGAGAGGWGISSNGDALGAIMFEYSLCGNIAGQFGIDNTAAYPWTENVWYYLRARSAGAAAPADMFLSVNAGAEISAIRWTPDVTSLENLWMGRLGGATHYHFKGNICYVHIWNNNQGALGAVPMTPFPIDANTVGRWIHSEGTGAALGDTSGNANDGTISGATWSPIVPAGWHL